jgi:hypothetical protein
MNAVIESPFANQQARTALAETSGAAQAQAREMAEMQTKFLMAERFPRDERKAMDGVLNTFSRKTMAEMACYAFAKGGSNVSGLSVHSMQAIAQQWGNMEFGWVEVSRGTSADGVPFSEVRAFAWDLQSRVCRPLQFIVRHWRDTKAGGYKLKDEREIYELCANMAQRRVRSCLEAVIPRDVQEAAEQQAAATLRASADTSPEAMGKMLAAFGPFGVTKDHIEKRIQRRMDAIEPAQVVMLKRIYASLRDEMSTAAEWFDMGEAPPPADAAGSLDAVRAAAAAKKGKPAAAKPAAGPVTMDPPTFDVPTTLAKIKAATDRETLALMADEFRDMADGADKKALLDAWSARDAELAEKA